MSGATGALRRQREVGFGANAKKVPLHKKICILLMAFKTTKWKSGSKVAQTSESDKNANKQPKPRELRFPKRGAFPTPKEEIERAKPYTPKSDQAGNPPAPADEHPKGPDAPDPKQTA